MEDGGVTIRRVLRILLVLALVVPVGLFVHRAWSASKVCEREFGKDTTDYEICTEYGLDPEGFCADLDRNPFRCSEEFIAGHPRLVAARHTGLFQARLGCNADNQVSAGGQCSPEQWDRYCSTYHGGARSQSRCRVAGPAGGEGVPSAELQAKASPPAGPLSGTRPDCGTLTTYEHPDVHPESVAVDAEGSVWFTEPTIGALSHMTMSGRITRRFLPARPGALARAPDGDLWFTDPGTNTIWQVTPSGETRRHPIPMTRGRSSVGPGGSSGSGLSDLTIGPDGTVWFIETEADQVGRITPGGEITELPLYGPSDGYIRPSSVTAAPDGSVWVSATLARRLARVDGRTLTIAQFPVATGGGTVDAQSVAADAAGGVWFERLAGSGMDSRPPQPALGRMDPTGRITYQPLPGAGPRWPGSLTAGPDGAIWFLDGPAKTVGRMAPDGAVTEFAFSYPELARGPTTGHLAAGSSALWFSQPDTKTLGLITCQGVT